MNAKGEGYRGYYLINFSAIFATTPAAAVFFVVAVVVCYALAVCFPAYANIKFIILFSFDFIRMPPLNGESEHFVQFPLYPHRTLKRNTVKFNLIGMLSIGMDIFSFNFI